MRIPARASYDFAIKSCRRIILHDGAKTSIVLLSLRSSTHNFKVHLSMERAGDGTFDSGVFDVMGAKFRLVSEPSETRRNRDGSPKMMVRLEQVAFVSYVRSEAA